MAGQSEPIDGNGRFRLPPDLHDECSPGGSGMLDEEQKMASARSHGVTGDFEDKRVERQRNGLIKYTTERGVPDVGGLGWRSKQGHVLKNQSYYSAFPNTNIWNNPAHAGPRTWKSFHGPRLRTDAALMENLDRLEGAQEQWDVKKMYVNSVRVQTLDRFYNQKIQNEQREIHSTWAPHRRAKREYTDANDRFDVELDSMPMKELKKVLTPCVLHGDREAIRNITKRIQREETWKATWKEMEAHRHQDTLGDFEERMTYNQMLADLAGQPTRRRDPNRKLPNSCSERVEELARCKADAQIDDVTQLTDFRGLIHVDHQFALEARFPGEGHAMSTTFREKAHASSAAGWPPPERPETPHSTRKVKSPSHTALKKGSVPVSAAVLSQAVARTTLDDYAATAAEQTLPNEAPPPPDQRRTVAMDKFVNDPDIMADMLAKSQSLHGSDSGGSPNVSMSTSGRHVSRPPPAKPMVYPVLVAVSPRTDAARQSKMATRLGGNLDSSAFSASQAASASSAPVKKILCRDVKVARLGLNIISATNLRGADRSGLSDPFCVVRIPGRPKSKFQTRVIKANLHPAWRESCEIEEFFAGDELEFAIYDKDIWGNECLGKATISQAMIMPDGVAGELELFDEKRPEDGPALRLKVVVLENYDPDGTLQAKAVRGNEDSDDEPEAAHEECRNIDNFEAALRPVPRLGNFWMTPRGDMRSVSHDGGAQRKSARGNGGAETASPH